MKNKVVKLALFSALFGFFAVSANSMAEAKAVAGSGNFSCNGLSGHCIVIDGVTYIGKAKLADTIKK